MDKDMALFEISVLAEQAKELVSLIPDCSRDSQVNAIDYTIAYLLRDIIKLTKTA